MRIYGQHEENTLAQLADVATRAEHPPVPLIVVMAGANEFDPYKD